jgi:hypothetical protein
MKTRGTSAHIKMFAPIYIGVVFGLAILGSFPVFMPSRLPVSNAMARVMTFEDCTRMPGSYLIESYPPTCVTSNGLRFTRKLPRAVTNPVRHQP